MLFRDNEGQIWGGEGVDTVVKWVVTVWKEGGAVTLWVETDKVQRLFSENSFIKTP